ncbi:hypothetical protein BCR33DRAFT_713623 [Rhizoclosmatium globosum]|uniref:Phosphoesterase-domain-containing protein n=1 Tax=Rhizoclosmatium globosum TaxID=329046 RepID=A0A1Y2CT68_9FUNG|nr:hypothetical protein BCR33DRAFT_713623 [Rhizoclosmatium globosum]|eukprot:ORY50044.1 hypothetical protein BCR33DRAFT_713623 [Rhizoclosmatium globosum]
MTVHSPPLQDNHPPRKWFDTIMIINLENIDYGDAISHPPFSTLNYAPYNGTLLTNYRALTHPSQPNYFAQVVGDGIVTSDDIATINTRCIVDLLEEKGISWASYAEGYPDNWSDDKPYLNEHTPNGKYVRRHVPLVSITSIQENPERARNIKSGEAFQRDLQAGTLPQYIYYTPDQDNNAHDTNIRYAGQYISEFLYPFSLGFCIDFDETAFWVGKNRVATWLLGTAVNSNPLPSHLKSSQRTQSIVSLNSVKSHAPRHPPVDTSATANDSGAVQLISLLGSAFKTPIAEKGYTDKGKFDHFSILKTVEENWFLGNLGRKDVTATSFGALLHEV